MSYSEDYMQGRMDAREEWQRTGSVKPFPADMELERTKAASKAPEPEFKPAPTPPKKAAPRKKTGGA